MKTYYCFYFIILLFLTSCENDDAVYSWKDVSPHVDSYVSCIDMLNPLEGYVGLKNGNPYHITTEFTDECRNCQLIDTLFYSYYMHVYDASFNFYEEQSNSTIYFTKDGAKNWNKVETPFKGDIISMDFYSKNIGYVVVDPEGIFLTRDAGSNWQKILINPIINGTLRGASAMSNLRVLSNGENKVYLYSDKTNFLCVSKDLGLHHWETLLNPYKDNPIEGEINDLFFFEGSSVGYLQSGKTLYKTDDAGTSWGKIAESVDNFQFLNESYGLIQQPGEKLITKDGGASWEPFATEHAYANMYYTYLLDQENYLFFQKGYRYFENFYLPKNTSYPELMTREKDGQISDVSFPEPNTGYITGNGMVLKWDGKGL